MKFEEQWKSQEETAVLEQKDAWHEIVLFNDEVNTFDWVIHCLMEICEHSPEQAEQCAVITHYKGKCSVKSGSYAELEPRCSSLLERGLSAEIN
ncbi:ATP-dependent Clp protease adaptor ClpS [Croceimicrobium hydrocarbonivorans]|uniref:ATP-dependent Clp protease adaptor ClpS n=1 Tax=Croceimicrobium hydrocarbonivorans TaxID=2761580 RepID=A0A7H0VCM3_9FLAO|nr:ATP-dependent Clp protease adaptor ClpS [Croceimicrobium hydrocarbonivorans]QNR23471.1 ATP-dependent Clp protease adaptor ClpS [Croceimicrobium hydrocarbonivorans]